MRSVGKWRMMSVEEWEVVNDRQWWIEHRRTMNDGECSLDFERMKREGRLNDEWRRAKMVNYKQWWPTSSNKQWKTMKDSLGFREWNVIEGRLNDPTRETKRERESERQEGVYVHSVVVNVRERIIVLKGYWSLRLEAHLVARLTFSLKTYAFFEPYVACAFHRRVLHLYENSLRLKFSMKTHWVFKSLRLV